MNVLSYITDYLEDKQVSYQDQKEYDKTVEGIKLYLNENGIDAGEEREYFKNYVLKHLSIIDKSDLKEYFLRYDLISRAYQIVTVSRLDGKADLSQKTDMLNVLAALEKTSIGTKYIPMPEIAQIIDVKNQGA